MPDHALLGDLSSGGHGHRTPHRSQASDFSLGEVGVIPNGITCHRLSSDEELMMEKIFKVTIDARLFKGGKLGVLQELYRKLTLQQSIVFVERKEDADRISRMMIESGTVD